MAELLGWSETKISKLEHGTRRTGDLDIGRMTGHCGVDDATFRRIAALATEQERGCVVRPHAVGMPDSLRCLILHERTAYTIHSYESMVVPGLLQTYEYARATHGANAKESSVQLRMDRQAILTGNASPDCTFFIHEAALRSAVGDAQVMYEQMVRLAMCSGWPQLSLRVVPFSAGTSPYLAGQFMHMTFGDHPAVTYVETPSAALFFDTVEATRTYEQAQQLLAEVALSPEESRSVFVQWADRYDQLRENRGVGGHEVA
jgi:hypothetical protein